ncbi:MAG: hypothetical protein ACH34Y_02425 [Brachymonas sp.]|jgi:hypothetical protein
MLTEAMHEMLAASRCNELDAAYAAINPSQQHSQARPCVAFNRVLIIENSEGHHKAKLAAIISQTQRG